MNFTENMSCLCQQSRVVGRPSQVYSVPSHLIVFYGCIYLLEIPSIHLHWLQSTMAHLAVGDWRRQLVTSCIWDTLVIIDKLLLLLLLMKIHVVVMLYGVAVVPQPCLSNLQSPHHCHSLRYH